jgi:hypothetical protein
MVNWVEDHTGVSWLWRGRFAVIEGFAAVESSDEEFLGLRLSILSAKTHTTTVRHSDFPTQFSGTRCQRGRRTATVASLVHNAGGMTPSSPDPNRGDIGRGYGLLGFDSRGAMVLNLI